MSAARVVRWSAVAVLVVAVSSFVYAGVVDAHATPVARYDGSGTTYNVTFTETGLAAGTNWSVSIGGWGFGHVYQVSSNASITFALPNGTYHYRVHNVPGYLLKSGSRGQVNVSGASPAPVAVTYSLIVKYTVTFTETGLPAGTQWSVMLHGESQFGGFGPFCGSLFGSSNTTTITFSLPNGTYFYHAHAHGFRGTNSTRGTFNVSGASPAPIVVSFISPSSGSKYTVSFHETGLPSGTNWTVRVASVGGWGGFRGHRHSLTETTSNATLNFSLPNGTYRYYVFQVPGYQITASGAFGTFNVSGASPPTINVVFAKLVNYTVTFAETGLPAGTNWTVTVASSSAWSGPGGFQVQTSNGTTITFSLPNGTYRYHIGHVYGYQVVNGSNGEFNVSGGSPPTISVTFEPRTGGGGVPAAAVLRP